MSGIDAHAGCWASAWSRRAPSHRSQVLRPASSHNRDAGVRCGSLRTVRSRPHGLRHRLPAPNNARNRLFALLHSLPVATTTMIATTLIPIPAAYALAHDDIPRKKDHRRHRAAQRVVVQSRTVRHAARPDRRVRQPRCQLCRLRSCTVARIALRAVSNKYGARSSSIASISASPLENLSSWSHLPAAQTTTLRVCRMPSSSSRTIRSKP